MHKETINIILASDDNYAQPLGVTIYSLLDNFKSEKYKAKINILDGGITKTNKDKLEKICKNLNAEIIFIQIPENTFKEFPTMLHFTKAIYYRLLIPNILGEDIEKAIYLDCDILVLGNIAELYEINIDNYYLGAVKDFVSDNILKNNTFFYKQIKKVFNSGVILMNIKKMREDNFVQKSIEFISKHSKELFLPDQDALNFLCIDKWLEIEKSWNFQVDANQKNTHTHLNILHFTNYYKPWHAFYHNYYSNHYKKYMKKAWPNYKIKPVSFIVAIKQIIKYIPFSVYLIGIIKKLF